MGIKHFFMWYKNRFSHTIKGMSRLQTLKEVGVKVDIFMIDLNGVFHTSAQKIFQYGNFKPHPRLLKSRYRPVKNSLQKQIDVFKDVCETIDDLYKKVQPSKKLVLCVDGSAPRSKQNQQRQRRFRSAKERSENKSSIQFDSSCITPGTKFMDYLTKYIDWYIRKKISEDPAWEEIDVIFSNEKVSGEGEAKLLNYIRLYGKRDDTYCIHGLDSDLIMLSLGTHLKNMYIFREDLYGYDDFHLLDIGGAREELAQEMKWKGARDSGGKNFDISSAINDFIFLCFLVGNDFLPHIPSLEIIEGGIEIMFDVYKKVGQHYGHLTKIRDYKVIFRKKSLEVFFGTIAQYEQGMFEDKYRRKDCYFPDPLVDKHMTQTKDDIKFNLKAYHKEYYKIHFPDSVSVESMCHSYLEGMQWVLSYYTRGIPNWNWAFPFYYAPFACDLAKHIPTYKQPRYGRSTPRVPFLQLLAVLPPASADLIPKPLSDLLKSSSPIYDMYPTDFEIDLAGKRKEWEGIVILPNIDITRLREAYFEKLGSVDKNDLRRNIFGKSFVYYRSDHPARLFKSYYGDIPRCRVNTDIIYL